LGWHESTVNRPSEQEDLLRPRLSILMRHCAMSWSSLAALNPTGSSLIKEWAGSSLTTGRPSTPPRLVAGFECNLAKHLHRLSDEAVIAAGLRNPVLSNISQEKLFFQPVLAIHPSS